jgi:hypothetical protein
MCQKQEACDKNNGIDRPSELTAKSDKEQDCKKNGPLSGTDKQRWRYVTGKFFNFLL